MILTEKQKMHSEYRRMGRQASLPNIAHYLFSVAACLQLWLSVLTPLHLHILQSKVACEKGNTVDKFQAVASGGQVSWFTGQ